MPPARSGVADYAASLLGGLRARGSVELAPRRCDIALYQLGNNALHAEMYARALDTPASSCCTMRCCIISCWATSMRRGMSRSSSSITASGARAGVRAVAGRAASGADRRYFDYPMLQRIAGRARAVVVHNPAAARIVREHAPEARVEEIPHLFAPPPLPSEAEIIRYRQRIGAGPERFLFGVFGYLRESKRLMAVLEAFRGISGRASLLVAGEFVSTDLARAVEPLLASPGVSGCRTYRSGSSGSRQAAWTPASTCGILPRARLRNRDPPDGPRQARSGNRLGGVLALP